LSDPPDASEHDQADQHHDDDARDPLGDAERGVQHVGNRIGLHHVADAEACKPAEQGEGEPEPGPLLLQPVFDGVHRAADVVASGIDLAVVHGEQNL
jgi:hypothetical protein